MMDGAKRGLTAQELERLHDEHVTVMYQHGMAMLRNEAAVRDLLQDIFLKLARSGGQAVGTEKERSYLMQMVHHGAIDQIRRGKVRQEHAAREEEPLFESSPDPDREAFRLRLEEALAHLPVEQREIVVLKLWEGRTFDEISHICGIPLNTAASRYRYALDKLRTLLRPIYEEL